MLLDASPSFADALTMLRAAGVRIVLGDFGTGHSSRQYLHRYKVDKIKIDRSFVGMLGAEEESNAIVRAMIQLGSAVRLQVAAEGGLRRSGSASQRSERPSCRATSSRPRCRPMRSAV